MLAIPEKLKPAQASLVSWWRGLSIREQAAVYLAIVVVLVPVVYSMFQSTSETFEAQDRKIGELERDMRALPTVLGQYADLNARKQSIEKQYERVEFKQGVVAHIEHLIRDIAGVTVKTNYNITNRPESTIGDKYERRSLGIRLNTTSIEKLVAFLEEVVRGEKPLVLEKLTISKRRKRGNDELEVEMNVSSISRI